jgi:hypothetical protein
MSGETGVKAQTKSRPERCRDRLFLGLIASGAWTKGGQEEKGRGLNLRRIRSN